MFVVGYKPSLEDFTSFVKAKWPLLDNISAILHEVGCCLVRCGSEADVNLIIKGGNFMIGKRAVLIRKWDEHFDFKRDILPMVPEWVRFLDNPTKLWGAKSLYRIGSLLGVPIIANECTTTQRRVSYAQVLIEVDVSKPLPKAILVLGHMCDESSQAPSPKQVTIELLEGTGVVSRRSLGDTSNEEETEWTQVTSKKKAKSKEVCSDAACSSDTHPSCAPRALMS